MESELPLSYTAFEGCLHRASFSLLEPPFQQQLTFALHSPGPFAPPHSSLWTELQRRPRTSQIPDQFSPFKKPHSKPSRTSLGFGKFVSNFACLSHFETNALYPRPDVFDLQSGNTGYQNYVKLFTMMA